MARATSPVVAVAVLLAITVAGVAGVGAATLEMAPPDERTSSSVGLSVDASANRLTLIHRGGSTIHASNASVRVTVGGRPLAHQPPVPYFAAAGFRGAPTGPFNSGADPRWTPGERTTIEVASTNAPAIESGDVVTVRIDLAEGHRVRARATAA